MATITFDPSYNTERAEEYKKLFTLGEWRDILDAAAERGLAPFTLIREAVLNDLAR